MSPFPDSPLAPEDTAPSLSVETLIFLSELLGQVTVSAGDPKFEQAAAAVIRARNELAAALSTAER